MLHLTKDAPSSNFCGLKDARLWTKMLSSDSYLVLVKRGGITQMVLKKCCLLLFDNIYYVCWLPEGVWQCCALLLHIVIFESLNSLKHCRTILIYLHKVFAMLLRCSCLLNDVYGTAFPLFVMMPCLSEQLRSDICRLLKALDNVCVWSMIHYHWTVEVLEK